MKQRLTLLTLTFFLALGLVPHVSAATISPSSVVIHELQTSGLSAGNTNGRLEFIELQNLSSTPVDVNGWQLNYFGGAGDITGTPTRLLATLQGTVAANGFVLLASPDFAEANPNITVDISFDAASTTTSSSGWLAQGGGAVQLAGTDAGTLDAVSWGTAKQAGTWWRSPEIPAGTSITRVIPTGQGATGSTFTNPGQPSPQGGGLQLSSNPPAANCSGLELSEILPNAVGADTGHEFIEIYNPTSATISMLGCSLQLGETGRTFVLPDETLPPGAYRAFSDAESGITLPNATGDTVWLHMTQEDVGVRYPDGLADDVAWAFIGGTWQATNKPTPSAENQTGSEKISEQATEENAPDILGPCAAGKERNPETSRCRTITATNEELAPCQPGQTRNLQTNRCRGVLAAATTFTSCKPGQERNPETNRCRNVAQATSGPKPCAPGQARNSSTNRCRKVTTSANFAKTQNGVTSSSTANKVSWLLATLAVVGAASYGIYEWRTDIRRATRAMCAKFRRTPSTP